MPRSTLYLVIALGCALTQLVGGCDKKPPPPTNADAVPNKVRIVSLSPAISRAIVDFGWADRVVGRTPHCASLDKSIPAVGDLLNINYEHIIRLQPTHILVQPPAAGVDPHLIKLAEQNNWHIAHWHLSSLDDIRVMIRDLPGELFADGTDDAADAARRSATLLDEMDAALNPGETPVYSGRTLLLYSAAPSVSVFGEDTYLDGVLKSLGGTNATVAKEWITFSLEDIVRIDPEAIIIVKPGAPNINVRTAMGPLWDLEITAVNERRLAILTHPDAFLPSTSVIGVATELRSILEAFEALAR